MSKKVYVFDEEGSRYEVNNIEAMLNELPDDGLELIYKSTRYFHEFNKTIIALIELGKIEQTEGEPYDFEGVELGLKAFGDKIKDRLGDETLAKFIEETDAQWEANKPEFKDPPTDSSSDEAEAFHEN
jgi:hypothetical protein